VVLAKPPNESFALSFAESIWNWDFVSESILFLEEPLNLELQIIFIIVFKMDLHGLKLLTAHRTSPVHLLTVALGLRLPP
jgi:hypothetical protein